MALIRILVADDSAVARRQIALMLSRDPELLVVGTAPTGRTAIEKVEQLKPDVLLLDLAMPDMNGLDVLTVVRKHSPHLPVLMFSALTERAGNLTLDALALGANDYLTKPSTLHGMSSLEQVQPQLVAKIKALYARGQLPTAAPRPSSPARTPTPLPPKPLRVTVLVIGASTGGPHMVAEVLATLPADFPVPVLVTQHMPPVFTHLFAERLNTLCPLRVQEARSGERVLPGQVWIAPGDHHLALVADGSGARLWTHQGPLENSCRPAVDVLFRSAAAVYGSGVLAVVMTGMGQDGMKGCQAVSDAGGQILVQEPETCVVGSMPRAVMQAGMAHWVVPLHGLGAEILRRVSRAPDLELQPRPGTAPSGAG
ncbi:protein-glutamate methylesterase/protein-glutamine glutaminase [Hyalangium rubrum]|uniref:Protein-glutamate methylesterase/protein-glutamine glutaminase n=1 Tax=Hyalangium rubrum TaxID=3103134 RepID=A0ABU5GWQ4_9BACT|nr:chemotaxis response regulator protein-glutamate methylesterase [Hyalangium sp. s54d21]MDY7225466.1 chemotaxis response regulator protein-glutamate methylesterase [Hyalangium sp. s54d21]